MFTYVVVFIKSRLPFRSSITLSLDLCRAIYLMASNKPQTKRIRSSANWLDRETAELIDLVERNPALYNKKAFEYMDKKKYSDLWPKIALEMGRGRTGNA